MTRDELLKRVARTICQNPPICACDDMRISCCSKSAHEAAIAAVDIALEEAARIAAMYAEENLFIASQAILEMTNEPAMLDAHMKTSSAHTAQQIAASIRALKSGDGE